jgi:hypothetical protein
LAAYSQEVGRPVGRPWEVDLAEELHGLQEAKHQEATKKFNIITLSYNLIFFRNLEVSTHARTNIARNGENTVQDLRKKY